MMMGAMGLLLCGWRGIVVGRECLSCGEWIEGFVG